MRLQRHTIWIMFNFGSAPLPKLEIRAEFGRYYWLKIGTANE